MYVRDPAVSGGFYPSDPEELRGIIKHFLDIVDVEKKEVKGILAPHAGYAYCGRTFAAIYKTIANSFETAVILGSNHSGTGSGVATTLGSWKTPLGLTNTDEEFFNLIIRRSVIMDDPRPHSREHSIEVQLPWLQYMFKDFKIVPILVKHAYYDAKSSEKIGNKIAGAVEKLGDNRKNKER